MSIAITNYAEAEGLASFRFAGGPCQAANALRRAIVAHTPAVAMVAFPADASTITITTNTSQLNNEILKQRLACVPIHITDRGTDVSKYAIRIAEEASGTETRNITTEHIQLLLADTNTPVSDAARRAVFPPSPLTGDYVLLARLRPAAASRVLAERLELVATMLWTEGAQGGSATSASTCAYGYTPDPVRQKETWEAEGKPGGDYDNWLLGPGAAIAVPDSFDFALGSVGVYTNKQLLAMGCATVAASFESLAQAMGEPAAVKPSPTTMPNCYDIEIGGDVYMTGPYVQRLVCASHCDGQPGARATYVGFRKPHPHDTTAILRIALAADEGSGAAVQLAQSAATEAARRFASIL